MVFLHQFVIDHGLKIHKLDKPNAHKTPTSSCSIIDLALTSRFRKRASGLYRFLTNSLHISIVLVLGARIVEAVELIPTVLKGTPFRRTRPAVVVREAPRMERESEGPACEFGAERVESCVQQSRYP